MTEARAAWGWGLATIHATGALDAYFPAPQLGGFGGQDAPPELAAAEAEDAGTRRPDQIGAVIIDLDAPPADTADAYLRLHLLSSRLVAPRTINLDGIFGVLPNVVWTSAGPCAVAGFEAGPDRSAGPRAPDRVRGGQVPADGRLRAAQRGSDRRRRPGAARSPPGRGHHRDARGLRQLQRRHPRHVDGRGTHLGRASSSVRTPTSAAGPRSWAPCRAAATR